MITNLTFTSVLSKSILTSAGFVLASVAFLAAPATANPVTFNLTDATNTNTSNYPTVDITLTETAPGVIQATVNVVAGPTGYIGDLRGVFLNLPSSATISGTDITALSGASNSFGSIGNSANLTGADASFSTGLEIGKQGIANGDDFRTTTFTISGTGLSLSSFSESTFGVRLMSVGTLGGNRDLSSKTLGESPIIVAETPVVETPVVETPAGPSDPVAVPEPMTMGGLLIGAGGLMAARRRKLNKNA